MDYSPAEKEAVHNDFERFLEELDETDREPDRWEEDCLSHSLTAMACGMYRLAAVEVKLAGTPLRERSPESMRHLSSTPQKFTKEHMRSGLARIKALAVEQD